MAAILPSCVVKSLMVYNLKSLAPINKSATGDSATITTKAIIFFMVINLSKFFKIKNQPIRRTALPQTTKTKQ